MVTLQQFKEKIIELFADDYYKKNEIDTKESTITDILSQKADKTNATQSNAGLMSAEDKVKLDEMEIGDHTEVGDLDNYYTKSQCDTQYSITVEKQSTADTGFSNTYVIKQNDTQKGVKINIPKDFLVKSATVKTCTTTNQPIQGYAVGDIYIDFIINSKDSTDSDEHLYLAAKEIGAYPVDEVTLTVDNGKLAIKNNGVTWAKLATAVQNTINGKEDASNRVNSVSASSTITQYPSAKCVYDTFCQKNDPRLSDARTPKSHSHNLKDLNIYADGQGGTNLIEDTQSFNTPLSNVGLRDGTYQNCTYRRVNNTSGTSYVDIKLNIPAGTFKHGEKYTVSFWAKGSGDIIVYNYGSTINYIKTKPINCTSGGTNTNNFSVYHDGNVSFTLTSEWKRYFVTWELNPTSDSTNDASVDKVLILRTKPGADVYWAGVMYERGEIPHDWSPSPKDKEKFDYREVKGTDNTSGYIKVLQIQINEGYQDKPITIELHQRDNIIKNNVSILFQNINSTDPLLKSILHNGDENLLVYLYKENNGIWSLITNKRYSGMYGEMEVKIDNPNTGISISKLDTHIASLPTNTSNNPLSLAKNVNLNTANYITSTHSSSTSTWTGTTDTITKLIKGTHIYYKLNQDPTTTNVTLNLTLADSSRSPTGERPVYIGGSRLSNQFPKYSVIGMIYDGSSWLVTNHIPTVTPCTVTYTDGTTSTINFVTR